MSEGFFLISIRKSLLYRKIIYSAIIIINILFEYVHLDFSAIVHKAVYIIR